MNRTKTLLILVILLLGLMPLFADHNVAVIITGATTFPNNNHCHIKAWIDNNTYTGGDYTPIDGCHIIPVPYFHDPGPGGRAHAIVTIGNYSWYGSAPFDMGGSFIHINVGGMPDTGKTPGTP